MEMCLETRDQGVARAWRVHGVGNAVSSMFKEADLLVAGHGRSGNEVPLGLFGHLGKIGCLLAVRIPALPWR